MRKKERTRNKLFEKKKDQMQVFFLSKRMKKKPILNEVDNGTPKHSQ